MAENFPGPYEVRIFYTTTPTGLAPMEHVRRLNVRLSTDPDPGDDIIGLNALLRGGGADASTLEFRVLAHVNQMRDWYPAATDFVSWELWRYVPGTYDAVFINASPIGLQGIAPAASNPAQQSIITFRTQEGGVMKAVFMESNHPLAQLPQSFPTASSTVNAFASSVVNGATGIWLARDTSYPVAPIRWLAGQSEALFKKRYRP